MTEDQNTESGEWGDQSEQEYRRSLNIHQRILAVMSEISYIQKGDKKVNNQYTFVSHDEVTARLHPLFVKHGIVCLTSVTNHDQDGNRTEVDITLQFVNVDNPEDNVFVHGFGHGIDPQDKGAGKAISYAVKSLILKTFLLETGERDNEADLIDHAHPINQDRVDHAYAAFKDVMDADVEVMDFERVQEGWRRLSNDERIAVNDFFGTDKPADSKRGYRAILKDLIKMVPEGL